MTKSPEFNIRIRPDDDDIRVDRWFKRHRPDVPHALIARWARTGSLKVDGQKASPSDRLEVGQLLTFPKVDVVETAPASATRKFAISEEDAAYARSMVIYKDDHALVLNKPPGLATQGGTKITLHIDGLLDALRFEKPDRPRLVHRLDKDTSGVLLLARTATAAGFFSKAFSGRTAHKLYWALVVGDPQPDDGMINAPIGKMPATGGEKMMVDDANGLAAKTRYQVIERAGTRAAWVAFEPLTGRTHQIRVHGAQVLKCPIVGDAKYGAAEAFLTGGISRKLHLHARTLTIDHPSGAPLTVTADLPTHMAETWSMLGFDAPPLEAHDPMAQGHDPLSQRNSGNRPSRQSPVNHQKTERSVKNQTSPKTGEKAPRKSPAQIAKEAAEAEGVAAVRRRVMAKRNSRRGARRTKSKRTTRR